MGSKKDPIKKITWMGKKSSKKKDLNEKNNVEVVPFSYQ
jgi:hypothetical protein